MSEPLEELDLYYIYSFLQETRLKSLQCITFVAFSPSPVMLQIAVLKIIDNKNCNAPYAFFGLVTDTMLCAVRRAGEADACIVCLTVIESFAPQMPTN